MAEFEVSPSEQQMGSTRKRKSRQLGTRLMVCSLDPVTVCIAVLLVSSLTMVSGATNVCLGNEVTLDAGEALVICTLSENVEEKRHGIAIKHFSAPDHHPVTILECVYLEEDSTGRPFCLSDSNFTLLGIQRDVVVARTPRSQLTKEGSYMCQLVPPPSEGNVFTACRAISDEGLTTTIPPNSPSTVACLPTGTDGGPAGRLVVAVCVMSFTSAIILGLNASCFLYYYLLFRKYQVYRSPVQFGAETVKSKRSVEGWRKTPGELGDSLAQFISLHLRPRMQVVQTSDDTIEQKCQPVNEADPAV